MNFNRNNNNITNNNEEEPRNVIEYKNDILYSPPHYEIESVNGYLPSFTVEQETEYHQFFKTFGFVIIRDVLSKDECQNTIDDIWNYIESCKWYELYDKLKESDKTTKRNDPKSWGLWPQLHEEGILGYQPVFTETALRNRSNLIIHKVYSTLLNCDQLYINHDRYGFFRPTKDVPSPYPRVTPHHHDLNEHLSTTNQTIEKLDFPKWKTIRNLHLDMNPFQYIESNSDTDRMNRFNSMKYKNSSDFMHENNEPGTLKQNELHIQGLINLVDNQEDDGGFLLVPGFSNHFVDFAKNNSQLKTMYGTRMTFVVIPDENLVHKQAIRITARAGSLVLWDQKTAHGSTFNNSHRPRMAQFIKMFKKDLLPKETLQRRSEQIKLKYSKNVNEDVLSKLSQQQRNILGLDLYPM
ncbi:putative phytanoyl-CoA dioxygenase [Tieghemostelium lacteum]|uniref:Putative phytanoyl-CoA dioxygenase n=1 Tax=Tieghemostelium lacteum TaxID=361077 RepID=A0A151ZBY5_TIELA|nr:putative phytanoyl-CoA dioxygenase [Tieghemostelium lacteum]|eukprot:KYQ91451.1 putative phytanoyl-CoA dioxygenase [Tieghemostelium lacteum]